MRLLVLMFLLAIPSACQAFVPASPSPTPLPSPTQTVTALLPTVTPSVMATLPPELASFDAALLPEFRGDLALVHSPTIYRLDLQLDPSLSHLDGEESVTYTNRTQATLPQIYFRLFPNYPPIDGTDKEIVSAVTVNGAAVTPTLESQDTSLKVPLTSGLAPEGVLNLDLKFQVTIPVSSTIHYADFTNSEGIITLPSIYPLIPAYDAKGWHTELPPPYGDLVYADASLFDVRFTAPVTMTVIASGTTVDTTTNGNDKTWHLVGAPMRDFSIDASSTLQSSTATVGPVTVNSYYLPQDESAGKNALKWAGDALGDYEKRIGPYPFKELDVVESPTTAGGIEYPGLVVISSDLYRDPRQSNFFEFAVAHEVGHQWWYAQVGDDQVNNPWMDESFVQYTTLLYFEDTYGADTANRILENTFFAEYNQAKKDNEDKPVGLPVSAYTEKQYGEIVYGKGPLFFQAVRDQIGDDAFFKFMQTYYQKFKYQIANPQDLLGTIDQVSGQKVDPLYNHWILGQ